MRLIGFDFTKISAEKLDKQQQEFSTSADVDIADIKEEKAEFLKDLEVVKVSFKFSIIFHKKDKKDDKFGEIILKGDLIFSAQEKEAKDLLSSWKKKEDEKGISPEFRVPLFNLIMRKCTPKALELEDSLGLPFHIPFPQITTAKTEAKKEEKK